MYLERKLRAFILNNSRNASWLFIIDDIVIFGFHDPGLHAI